MKGFGGEALPKLRLWRPLKGPFLSLALRKAFQKCRQRWLTTYGGAWVSWASSIDVCYGWIALREPWETIASAGRNLHYRIHRIRLSVLFRCLVVIVFPSGYCIWTHKKSSIKCFGWKQSTLNWSSLGNCNYNCDPNLLEVKCSQCSRPQVCFIIGYGVRGALLVFQTESNITLWNVLLLRLVGTANTLPFGQISGNYTTSRTTHLLCSGIAQKGWGIRI